MQTIIRKSIHAEVDVVEAEFVVFAKMNDKWEDLGFIGWTQQEIMDLLKGQEYHIFQRVTDKD